jgi:hypothetical protein
MATKLALKSDPTDDKFRELGVTGLRRYAVTGDVYEEFLPELRGAQGRRVYREMADNDPIVGAVLYVIRSLVRNVDWRVEGGKPELRQFVESCMHDMSHTWDDFISEVLSMLVFGWSFHEIVYKRRLGPSDDPAMRSQYRDGRIGWRKLPIRAQETLAYWEFDDEGGIRAFLQLAPPSYRLIRIPIERGLLFRTEAARGNPEGRSILRNAYRPWFIKKRIENIEAIGVERDLAGLPVAYLDPRIWDTYRDQLLRILRNVRRDEQEGILLPLVRDEQGNQLIDLRLMTAAGSRQFDTTRIIERYNRAIAMTVLADFILMGHERVGSFALASSKTSMFATALGATLGSITAVLNRYAIPRLLQINGWDVGATEMPRIVYGDLESPDLDEISSYITRLASAGAQLFPDPELEAYLRRIAHLPAPPEDGGASDQWLRQIIQPGGSVDESQGDGQSSVQPAAEGGTNQANLGPAADTGTQGS